MKGLIGQKREERETGYIIKIIEIGGKLVLTQEIPDSNTYPKLIGIFMGEFEQGTARRMKQNGYFEGCELIERGNRILIVRPFEINTEFEKCMFR